jgi:hypothetical protein
MKSTLWLALFLIAGVTHAQEFKFTLGPPIDGPLSGYTAFFNTTLKKGYRINLDGAIVNQLDDYIKFNGNGTAIKSEMFNGKEKAIIEGFYASGEKNYILYSTLDKASKDQNLYVQELSSSMLLLGSAMKVASYKDPKGKTREFTINLASKLFSLSSLYVIKSVSERQMIFVKEREHQLEVKAFSPDKGELWVKTFDLDKELDYDLSSIKEAENGNVYFAGQYYKKTRPQSPFLLAYSPSKNIQRLHTVTSGEKITDVGYLIELIEEEVPVFAGIYNEKKESGYKVFKLNKDNFDLQLILSKPFATTYSELMRKAGFEPEYFSVVNLFQLKNKNIILDVEGGMEVQSSSMQGFVMEYSSPAYITAISDATEKWSTVIRKYQMQNANKRDLVGHGLFYKENKVYMLYNDDIGNFDRSPTDEDNKKDIMIHKKNYVATIEIDETGKVKKLKHITTTKDKYSLILAREVKKIDSDHFHFFVVKDGKYHFATLEAKN